MFRLEVQMIEPTESTRRITDIPSENDVTIARTRTASNRENLSRLAQRVEGDAVRVRAIVTSFSEGISVILRVDSVGAIICTSKRKKNIS